MCNSYSTFVDPFFQAVVVQNHIPARKELRDDMRKVLAGLDARWVQAASAELSRNLAKLIDGRFPADSYRHILAWAPYFPGEIDLSGFISAQLGVREVYLPRVAPDHQMTFIAIAPDWQQRMAAGHFGIPEPAADEGRLYAMEEAAQTVVIIPGLAFDKKGDRLGRGGGCYDRLFADVRMAGARKVGVCWSIQLVSKVPVQEHDVPVEWLCHERGLHQVK